MKTSDQTLILLINSKSSIVENAIQWQRDNFPDRTEDYNKCTRDLSIVFDAYLNDLKSDSTRNITYVGAKYWFNNARQIINHTSEISIHNYMVDYIVNNILQTVEDQQKIINLKNVLINIIEVGPEYMTYAHMHKYKHIIEYDTIDIPDIHLVKQCLHEAWNNTPSKQNFMPYNVFVIGPGDKTIKEKIYYKSIMQEYAVNLTRYEGIDETDPKAVEAAMIQHRGVPPQFINFKTAPYVLLFTQRIENEPNPFNQYLTDRGWSFEQTNAAWKTSSRVKNKAFGLVMLEIGMFANAFSNLCLMNGIDISYTRCLPTHMNFWADPDFSFLENPPQLIMTAGKGKVSRREFYTTVRHGIDYKPDFERIVKFIN